MSNKTKKYKMVIEKEFARNWVINYQSRWFHTRIIHEIEFDTIEELEKESLKLYRLAARLVQYDIETYEKESEDETKTTVKKATKKTKVKKGRRSEK